MENAYNLALNIADAVSKRKVLNQVTHEPLKTEYEALSWQEMERKFTSDIIFKKIKEEHQIIFEEALIVLKSA